MCCGNPLRSLIYIDQLINNDNDKILARSSTTESELLCPDCQNVVQAAFSWCPACGSALKPLPCTYCGNMLSIKDQYCRSCGAPVSK